MAIIKGKPTPGDDNVVANGGGDTIDALHPRLFVRSDDLPRLRKWAVETNPIYQDGLKSFAADARTKMIDGVIPNEDKGTNAWVMYPTERYAELFAFMSLVSPDETERDDYRKRARTLLMHVMNKAVLGVAPKQPFRDPGFSTGDRARWSGEAFALTVDWIYPTLTETEEGRKDLSTIRTVFLRWIQENLIATTTNYNYPLPAGVVNDPALLEPLPNDPKAERVRWAGNNYYASHMRNIGLMAMALDPADDPDNTLRNYLSNATGTWLYVIDHLLRNDLRGGLSSEGLQYGPQTLSYIAQFLLALQTAKQDDPAVWGQQVVLNNNPFWSNVVSGYLHSLSPRSKKLPREVFWRGPVYQPAWYGAAENYWMPDMIDLLAPLALHAQRAGNPAVADPIRWIQTHAAPGGNSEQQLVERVRRPLGESALESIFYFLLFDPNAPAAPDPRPDLPLAFTAPGLGRILARTGWDEDATLFGYMLGWSSTDHQSANGNHIELYRKGEWLLKQRTGYTDFAYLLSDNHNTLALENDPPRRGGWRKIAWERGSQWQQGLGGDGRILAQSIQPNYVYALGDSTELYNAPDEDSTDVLHASRSVVWLKPDHIVVYDRATTKTANRFKRFWLNLPALPTVNGQSATMPTEGGQKLVVSTLLPLNAEPVASLAVNEPEPGDPEGEGELPANGEPMKAKLVVQTPGNPADTRFLHVLQAADATTTADATGLIQTSAGTPFAGALVGTQVVLFPVSLNTLVTTLTYTVPAAAQTHMITGLQPNGTYDVVIQVQNNLTRTITIRTGATHRADSGGVLVFTTGQSG